MTKIVNHVNVRPDELTPGDVMIVTVTCHVIQGWNGKPRYRVYRCVYPHNTYEGVPQGSQVDGKRPLIEQLFPVVKWAEIKQG